MNWPRPITSSTVAGSFGLAAMTKPRPTKRELAAMGHHLADIIETKARDIRARYPGLSRVASINAAIAEMAGE